MAKSNIERILTFIEMGAVKDPKGSSNSMKVSNDAHQLVKDADGAPLKVKLIRLIGNDGNIENVVNSVHLDDGPTNLGATSKTGEDMVKIRFDAEIQIGETTTKAKLHAAHLQLLLSSKDHTATLTFTCSDEKSRYKWIACQTQAKSTSELKPLLEDYLAKQEELQESDLNNVQ